MDRSVAHRFPTAAALVSTGTCEGASELMLQLGFMMLQSLSLRPIIFPFNCIVAHRLVACTANEDEEVQFVVDVDGCCAGAQDNSADDDADEDATEEMDEVRDGRTDAQDETSEY